MALLLKRELVIMKAEKIYCSFGPEKMSLNDFFGLPNLFTLALQVIGKRFAFDLIPCLLSKFGCIRHLT